MARDNKRVQRYRATIEFELKDRGDYAYYRGRFEYFLSELADHGNVHIDYLAIQKVDNALPKP